MKDLKIFYTDKHNIMYLLYWDEGYVQLVNQWKRFFNWDRFNWIQFTPIQLEIEYDKVLGTSLHAIVTILGIGIYYYHVLANDVDAETAEQWMDRTIEIQEEDDSIIEDLAVDKDAPASLRERAAASIAGKRELKRMNPYGK